jgi:hypothetical protein
MSSLNDGFKSPTDLATSCHNCRDFYSQCLAKYRQCHRETEVDRARALELEDAVQLCLQTVCRRFRDDIAEEHESCPSCTHYAGQHGMNLSYLTERDVFFFLFHFQTSGATSCSSQCL